MPIVALFMLVALPLPAVADPWLAPGDAGLRSDIQLLADEGVVRTPVTSWPLSWADIVRDLQRLRATDLRTPSVADAYARVQREARRQTRTGVVDGHVDASAALEPVVVRGFEDLPREAGSVGAGIDWIGDRFATRLQVQRVWEPDDGEALRFDGSYAGMVVGNVMISAGWMEKWWGPGWAGSLILSSNARPIPSLTVERNVAEPFEWPVLRWLGPWRASFHAGQLEANRGDFPKAHFIALRLTFRPARGLELGLSRTAQLCGEGRRCTPRTYWDMAIGHDNDQAPRDQPGNQLAGFDVRWAPARRVPLAVYGQAIGEDEAGYLPSRYLGMGGVETWGRVAGWNLRGYGEYARTSCNFSRAQVILRCAYENGIYTDGYRYRGRAIGYGTDRDSKGWAAGAIATRERWQVTVRAYNWTLNEARHGPHTLAAAGGRLRGVEAGAGVDTRWGRIRAGLRNDEVAGAGVRVPSGTGAFVEWRSEV